MLDVTDAMDVTVQRAQMDKLAVTDAKVNAVQRALPEKMDDPADPALLDCRALMEIRARVVELGRAENVGQLARLARLVSLAQQARQEILALPAL